MASLSSINATPGASISLPCFSMKSYPCGGLSEYRKWYVGEDDEEAENTPARYKFPHGDFEKVHRCGVLSAQSRAGQYKYFDTEAAAAHLHGMIEGAT
jgi:hypothetical protein